ncbi:MAG: CHAD domain-containing protein [Solirubrobacterales bacterium]
MNRASGDRREVGGECETAVSASYRFRRRETAAEGVRRIARGRAERAKLGLLQACDGGDIAGSIHAARKDFKKLRSLLRLARSGLDPSMRQDENRRFRDAGRALAASRDAEVKLETVAALQERFPDRVPGESVRRWSSELSAERDARTAAPEAGLSGIEEASAMIDEGLDQISAMKLSDGSWGLLEPGLRRSYGRGRRAMLLARERPSPENVHEWRKRAKDLWYQLRLMHSVWPAVLEPTIEQAHELADLLGDHHDLAVLADDLRDRDTIEDRDELDAAIERRQRELLEAALDLGERLYAEKAKAFARRMGGYWVAWRRIE